MITQKERKTLIIKYLQKNPLSNFRQIRINHAKHEYHSQYLHNLLDQLIQEKKLDTFLQRYYAVPKSGKEVNLLIAIVKSVPLTKPTFKTLSFDNTLKNPTIKTIINNCISLYHLKLKIHNFENIIPQRSFNPNFIKFLKTFSDDNYYTEFMVDKGFFKKNSLWKIKVKSNNTLEKRILNFLRLYWTFSLEYYAHLKNNRIPLKETFSRIFKQSNEGKSITAEDLGITNKALKRSLDQLSTKQGIYIDVIEYDSKGNLMKPEKDMDGLWPRRPQILQIGLNILEHRTPSKRKKYAKIAEEQTGIPFTKLIPLDGYSNILKDARKDPKASDD